MNQINTNYNNYGYNQQPVRFKSEAQAVAVPEVQLPDLYYTPDYSNKPKGFKEFIKKYDLMGLIYNWLEHPFMMLGTCFGISYGIDLFDKSCNKPYEESIVGKASKFGDKIESSSFVQKKEVQSALTGVKNGWTNVKNFFMKSSVIRSMFETPSVPEWEMPKSEMKDINYRLVEKFKNLASKFNLYGSGSGKKNELTLSRLGLDKSEIQYLKDTYNVSELSEIKEASVVDRINLRRLGKTEAEITALLKSKSPEAITDEIIKISGLTKDEWKRLMEDTEGKEIELAKKASERLKNLRIFDGRMVPGSYQPFANLTSFGEVSNRIESITLKDMCGKAKTKTGAAMAKFVQMLHRGFTFGGTKLGVLFFVAPSLVDMVLNTRKADPEEKVGTVADGLITSVSWVFVFPLALKTMHALGGIQYAGMGKEKVELYRKKINDFNKLVDEQKFTSKEKYDTAKRALKDELKALKEVKDQNLLTRILRKISAFTKADLEKIHSFKNESTIGNLWRKMPNFLKDASYSPARFLIFMMALVPFYDKIIEGCTSKIFGKPYDGMKEEEFADKKKEQEEFTMKDLQERMLEIQKNKLNPAVAEANNAVKTAKPIAETKGENPAQTETIIQPLNEQADTEQVQQTSTEQSVRRLSSVQPKADNYTYIPSAENILKNAVNNTPQINKYIPSQLGANFTKTFDNSGLDAALQRASRAEKRALETLAGNFNV